MTSPLLSSIFDGVYLLGYTGMRDRIVPMIEELDRVGFRDVVEVFWNYPSPYDKVFKDAIPLATNPRYFNVTMGHYRMLKTAQCLNKESVLILEDDVRFIKDHELLESSLCMIPADYNIAMLDHHWANGIEHSESSFNKYWAICNDKRVSSAAYALNRQGIDWLVGRYEECLETHAKGLRCCDQYFCRKEMADDFHFYVSTPHLCVQKPCGKANTPENDLVGIYRKMCVQIGDYGQ